MRKPLYFSCLVVLLVGLLFTPARSAEYYISLKIDSPQEITKLTKIISIDNVPPTKTGVIRAYANDTQLAELARLGYTWEELPHPGSLIQPEMSSNTRDIQAWDTYPTYDAYVAMMYQFETDYPGLCEIVNAGTTVQGRAILFAKISDNVSTEEDEPEVMYTSTMHGDETTGYVLMLRLIDSLLSSYGTDPTITNMVDSMEIWINPLANPDGTYNGGNSTVSGATRYNANGVDPNRNFPDPQDGPHPDGNSWQPETIAMMNLAQAHRFIISANFHGGAEVVNYPWDTWSRLHADDGWYQTICHQYADTAQAHSPSTYMDGFNDGITNGYAWYEVDGGRQDYMNYYAGCREVTIELSNTKLLPASELPAHWEYNRVSFLEYLRHALRGIRGIVTDAVTGLPVAATISILNHDVDSSEVYTDPDVGDYHRMIPAGSYDVVYSAPGYYPDTVFGVSVSPNRVTIVDVQLQPLPNEPVMSFVSHTAGNVDPGDTVSMNVTLQNNGAGNATNLAGILTTNDAYVIITQNSTTYPTITALGGTGTSQTPYEFIISPSCPLEHEVQFVEQLTADGGYADSVVYSIMVGLPIEDYETGNFSSFAWQMSGNQGWVIVTSPVYEGMYSAKSGSITDNQSSSMSVTFNDLNAGTISFYYKVSSEASYDWLRFYIDGVQKGEWSGTIDWTEASYAVSTGSHTFRWTYSKDGSVSSGSDCSWVDYITFPVENNDADNDGIPNTTDNCPNTYNPGQEDTDGDTIGDVCDNCPTVANTNQLNSDSDSFGDACDNCPTVPNPGQEDADSDTIGDVCDNCPTVANTDQLNSDSDSFGDACDNCPTVSNPGQEDADSDTIGDVCDNCPTVANTDQLNSDTDSLGDVCDNCPTTDNPDQADTNNDGVGDACCCVDRGNVDGLTGPSGPVDISDVTYLVNYLFQGGIEPPCPEEGNVDAIVGTGGAVDVSDLTYLIGYLFTGGPQPPSCP